MTRTIALVVGAIALIAGVVWFLTHSDEAGDVTIEPRVHVRPADPMTVAERESAHAPDPLVRVATAANTIGANTDAVSSGVPTSRTWTTRIVDAETGQPVAGARVWIVPRSMLRETRWAGLDTLVDEPMTILEREPPIGVSRADGTIDVPEPGVASVLAAQNAGTFGARHIAIEPTRKDPDYRPIELRLYRDATLRVEVVDDAGTPRPFVPVDLVTYPYVISSSDGTLVHRVVAEPGATHASISHARWRLAGGGQPFLDEHGSFALRTGVLMLVNPEVGIEPEPIDAKPIRIVVPPCAPIVVRLLDVQRKPWQHRGTVRARNVQWFGADELELQGGDAQFDAVSVTPAFSAIVRPDDPHLPELEVSHAGPREPWAALLLVARLPEPSRDVPLLIGRVLDVDGSPFANTEFLLVPLRPVPGRGAEGPPRFKTSNDGTFRLPYSADQGDPINASERNVIRCDHTGGGFHPEVRARITLPHPLTLGTHDLGDIRLASTPVLVSGFVQTTTGRRVANAAVHASTHTPNEPSLSNTTDIDGSFTIYDRRVDTSAAQVEMYAYFEGIEVKDVPFAAGTRNAILTLPAFGTFSIRALVDKGVDASHLSFYVGTDKFSKSLARRDAGIEVTHLAGETSIRVVSNFAPDHVLASIDHIVVEDGACTRDSRLNPIDLRDRVFRIAGRVVDANGENLGGARILAADNRFEIEADGIGRFTLTLPTRVTSLRVSRSGYETVEIPEATDGLVVRLAKDE